MVVVVMMMWMLMMWMHVANDVDASGCMNVTTSDVETVWHGYDAVDSARRVI